MLENFTFEEWKTLFERFRAESADDNEAYDKLTDYIRRVLFGIDWLEEKTISPERCEEINRMKIPCPWGGYKDVYKPYFIMDAEGHEYYSNDDESIILDLAFFPKHDDIDIGRYNDTYLLVKDKKYYLFNFVLPHNAPSDSTQYLGDIVVEFCPNDRGPMQVYFSRYTTEIAPNIKIDSSPDKTKILKIIKDFLIFKNNRYANEIYDITVQYGGKEVE